MRSLTSNSLINFKNINGKELPVYRCSMVGEISEQSVMQRAKNVFYKYNMRNYTKALYIQCNGDDDYAIIGCYSFKKKFKKFKGNKTLSSWNEYKVFKIKYDNLLTLKYRPNRIISIING